MSLRTGVALSEVCGKVKEKYFNTKYKLEVILLDVKAAVYFKFKLQLKFGNNKNYSSISANFHAGLR